MDDKWTKTSNGLPNRVSVVDWISAGGEQVNGGKYDGLWFLPPEHSMYCYYTPVFWRYARKAGA